FLLLPVLFWKKLSTFSQFSLLVFAGYTLYLVLIGGDVLKAHRFFVPILFFLYPPLIEGLFRSIENWPRHRLAFAAAIFLSGFFAYGIPKTYLDPTAAQERGLVAKMRELAGLFVRHTSDKSFANSTIGAFSYYAGNRRVLDMLGLTEPAIAKNPESIPGIESSWKEKNFNAGYILSQKPDVIVFSTEMKPSSPAERALFLYPEFRQNYRLEFLYRGSGNSLSLFYRRFKEFTLVTGPDQPAAFANALNEGLNLTRTDGRKSLTVLKQALETGPKDCAVLYMTVGYLYTLLGFPESSGSYLHRGLELDGGGSLGQWYYVTWLNVQKRYDEATQQLSDMIANVPTAEEFLVARGVLKNRRVVPLDSLTANNMENR
ncbi:MAG TPA: hypothetical protein VNL73_02355, partial [Verrucomicrobiae bacterium]|nr:hypothetical protein [Verrucomicrobiae bacterium]